ncbi:MAG: TIGR02996 domain-containing protein [Rubripirellula sp.]
MTGDDRLPFLRQIIADPDDDDHRLVYADWLEEHGDRRGEFIRAQCEYDRTMPHTKANVRAFDAARDLFQRHGSEWLRELGHDSLRDYEFRRGFVSKLEMTANTFLEHGERILSSTPLDCIRLPYLSGKLNQLIESGLMLRLRGIDLCGLKLSARRVKRILDSTPRLRRLLLRYAPYALDAYVAEAIMGSPSGELIEELSIDGSAVDPEFFQKLAFAGGLRRLKSLRIGSEQFGVRDGDQFEQWQLPDLEELCVSGNLRVAEMTMLAKRVGLKQIKIGYGALPAKGLRMMIDSGAFAAAERIELQRCNLSERAGIALLASDLSACRHLNLAGNQRLSDACWIALMENETAGKVESLVAAEGTFSRSMFEEVGKWTQLHPLTENDQLPGGS